MTHRGLIGAVLYAKNLDRLVQFYASITGTEPQTIEQGFAAFRSGPSQLTIVRIPKRLADTIEIATPAEPRENTPLKLAFAVEDIAQARQRAAALGGAVNAAASEWEFAGDRICDGHDPEGNIFQLKQTC